MDKIVQVRGLKKSFGDLVRVEVLHGLDLDFDSGSFTALIGPSGSGKTTFLNIISLLEPPTAGKLTIDGRDFSTGDINEYSEYRNSTIGFIFQFHYLLPEFTALENILIPYWIGSGRPPEKLVKKGQKIMEEIGILGIKDKYPNQLSGGQQQRVSIARALVKDPKIIFADEPTGNLDRESGSAVLDVMTKLVKESGTTLIMVTHDREIALRADRVVELVDGKICKSFYIGKEGEAGARQLLEERACVME